MHPYVHNSVNSPPDVGNEVSRCMRRENRLLWSCIQLYSYMQFSKTHRLMLAMHEVSRWGEKTGYSGHASIHTQVSKTHLLMLAMKWTDEKLEKQVTLVMHPYINLVKLTAWCWQWSTQIRRETGYFMHPYIHNSVNSPPDVGNEVSRWGEKQVTLVIHPFSYMQFSKTHCLMLAMHEVSRWGENWNRLIWSCIHACTIQ